MQLEIDAGNTRIKWRLVGGPEAACIDGARQGAFAMAENSPVWDKKFFDAIAPQLSDSVVERVLISNVRGDGFRNSILGLAKEVWGVQPEFAHPVKYCAGVTNGYNEPGKLGVDRWLSILAAYNLTRSACCVLNCGTTITFDVVSEDGNHEGGYILPGLQLMKDALLARSPVLVSDGAIGKSLSPGRDTASAINSGVLMSIIGFATGMRSATNLMRPHTAWIISGGDGKLIHDNLDWDARLCPSLVLDGLSLAIPGNNL